MYTFNFTISEKDILEFNVFHNDNTSFTKTWRFLWIFITIVVFVICMLFMPVAWVFFGLTGVFALSAGIIFIFRRPFVAFWSKILIRSMKKRGKLPVGENNQLNFDENGFHAIGENGEFKLKYHALKRVRLGKAAIYLCIGPRAALTIPKRAFESKEQGREFLSFIRGKVQNQ